MVNLVEYYPFYRNCDVLTEQLIQNFEPNNHLNNYFNQHALPGNIEVGKEHYRFIARYSSIIDLIPFYSPNFNPEVNNQTSDIAREYFNRILNAIIANNDHYIIINANSFLDDVFLFGNPLFNTLDQENLDFGNDAGRITHLETNNNNVQLFSVSNCGGWRLTHANIRQYADWIFEHLGNFGV